MPDRDLVDEMCPQRVGVAGSWHHWSAPDEEGKHHCLDCGAIYLRHIPDRAVVAISEDRQWLVVHHLGTGRWIVYDVCHWGYQEYTTVVDTGQDAHEVLREFLEGR